MVVCSFYVLCMLLFCRKMISSEQEQFNDLQYTVFRLISIYADDLVAHYRKYLIQKTLFKSKGSLKYNVQTVVCNGFSPQLTYMFCLCSK